MAPPSPQQENRMEPFNDNQIGVAPAFRSASE
jgi:hypothetical protein